MLTEKAVLATRPGEKDYKVADGGGLHLLVTRAGARSWRYKYRFGGKEKLLVIGRHPDVGLKAARLARDEAKGALAKGRDPSLDRRRVKLSDRAAPRRRSRNGRATGTSSRRAAGSRCTQPTSSRAWSATCSPSSARTP